MTTPNGGHNPGPPPKTRPDATPAAPPLPPRGTTGGGHPRSHDGRQHDEPEVGPSTPSGVSSSWMDDPEMQAAALEGLASNPIAQTYTEGEATPETRSRLLAARDAALISGTDPGSLAFIVRDLMDAAGYEYDPERPLADQSRECCDLIRLTASEWHLTIAARANDSERHEAEVGRFTSLLDEMRRQLRYALKLVDNPTIVAWRRKPRLAMPLPHEWDELVRERDRLKEQLGQGAGHPCNGGFRCTGPEHIEGCLSGDVTIPKADADSG